MNNHSLLFSSRFKTPKIKVIKNKQNILWNFKIFPFFDELIKQERKKKLSKKDRVVLYFYTFET